MKTQIPLCSCHLSLIAANRLHGFLKLRYNKKNLFSELHHLAASSEVRHAAHGAKREDARKTIFSVFCLCFWDAPPLNDLFHGHPDTSQRASLRDRLSDIEVFFRYSLVFRKTCVCPCMTVDRFWNTAPCIVALNELTFLTNALLPEMQLYHEAQPLCCCTCQVQLRVIVRDGSRREH